MPMTLINRTKTDDLRSEYHGVIQDALNRGGAEIVLFSHYGDFSQAKSDQILKLIESAVIEAGDKRKTMKRICGVLIEMIQNISIHGARLADGHNHAYVIVSKIENGYRLSTGNLILSNDANSLGKRMTELAQMDKADLRRTYIETLCDDDFSAKGGAGLGLLTIAKRADQGLSYSIQSHNELMSYFQLSVVLENE
jgi:hypothetical protein